MTGGNLIRTLDVCGYEVTVDDALGKLCVAHDGAMSWDRLQEIKTIVWGPDARAIEVYPRAGDVVNNGCYRHLWRLGVGDFCPDLLGYAPPDILAACDDRLLSRCHAAWSEADAALPGQARVWAQSGSEFK